MTGLLETVITCLWTINTETMAFTGYVTDRDKPARSSYDRPNLPSNVRGAAEHVRKVATTGKAYPVHSQLAGIKCHLTRIDGAVIAALQVLDGVAMLLKS